MKPEPISCIIIDDEIQSISLLSKSLEELFPNMEIKRKIDNWRDALDAIKNENFDILFTDISMPGKTGMDVLRLAGKNVGAEIIFVTAYPDFALDAFKFFAAGYLLKPIDDNELFSVVEQTIARIITKRNKQKPAKQPIASKIGIPNAKGIDYIDTEDILYFETVNKCTRVVMQAGEILSSYNIGKFKSSVDEQLFFQVHRSYIVNLNEIKRYETSGTVLMSDGYRIPVSKTAKDSFLQLFSVITKSNAE